MRGQMLRSAVSLTIKKIAAFFCTSLFFVIVVLFCLDEEIVFLAFLGEDVFAVEK